MRIENLQAPLLHSLMAALPKAAPGFSVGEGIRDQQRLHLAGESLVSAEVVGGVWMSNLDSSGTELRSRPISFKMSGNSALHFSRPAISEALARIPPTQLGWRMLYPDRV